MQLKERCHWTEMLRASTLFGSFFSPYRDFRATENLSIQKNVEASKKIRQISSHSLKYYY